MSDFDFGYHPDSDRSPDEVIERLKNTRIIGDAVDVGTVSSGAAYDNAYADAYTHTIQVGFSADIAKYVARNVAIYAANEWERLNRAYPDRY